MDEKVLRDIHECLGDPRSPLLGYLREIRDLLRDTLPSGDWMSEIVDRVVEVVRARRDAPEGSFEPFRGFCFTDLLSKQRVAVEASLQDPGDRDLLRQHLVACDALIPHQDAEIARLREKVDHYEARIQDDGDEIIRLREEVERLTRERDRLAGALARLRSQAKTALDDGDDCECGWERVIVGVADAALPPAPEPRPKWSGSGPCPECGGMGGGPETAFAGGHCRTCDGKSPEPGEDRGTL